MAYNAPEGTADMLPAAARLWRSTVDSAAKLFGTYGYEPIYTPLFEITDVFTHGIGEATDYTLEEVGNLFGLTRERIRQIEAKALQKMRSAMLQNHNEIVIA